uniref:Uncharacterized protein n=1 Tax=Arundo donax TaxID=35708 RepID=A0A0A9C9T6_ARUDO
MLRRPTWWRTCLKLSPSRYAGHRAQGSVPYPPQDPKHRGIPPRLALRAHPGHRAPNHCPAKHHSLGDGSPCDEAPWRPDVAQCH